MTSLPSDLELRLQRFGHLGAAGRDDDRVVRRVLGPAARSVAMQHVHVAVAQVGKRRSGFFGELADALYRVDAARDTREDCRGVARAGADLEHLLAAFERQCIGHQRNDVGLRDRLALRDRQRRVFVGEFPHRLGQKRLPRNGSHRVEHQGECTPRLATWRSTMSLRSRAESVSFIDHSFGKPALTLHALLAPARTLLTVCQAFTNRPGRLAEDCASHLTCINCLTRAGGVGW